ncbi:hypothetical protein ACLOJK_026777 [Asimina triloba]
MRAWSCWILGAVRHGGKLDRAALPVGDENREDGGCQPDLGMMGSACGCHWPDLAGGSGRSEMGFNPYGFGRGCWRDARWCRLLGRDGADGFGKGVGSWAADD